MCSINGVIILNTNAEQNRIEMIEKKLNDIIVKAEDRGRDSFGITIMSNSGDVKDYKFLNNPSCEMPNGYINENTTIVINNNRAEPTTEFVKSKSLNDVQPFSYKNISIVHNGIIANDKEIEKELGNIRNTKIDSAVISPLLNKYWTDNSLTTLKKILNEKVVGSYALGIINNQHPHQLVLTNNYKPIYIQYDNILDCIFFSSLKKYMDDNDIFGDKIEQLSPYSITSINTSGEIFDLTLRDRMSDKKVLVVCSGGLDSTVVAAKMVKDGYDVTLLHFLYKCRAEDNEKESIINIANRLGCKYMFVDTNIFKDVIGGSRLTNTKEDNEISEGEAGAELAWEWVPARNLIMLSIATGIAEARGIGIIALGNNLEESGAYPDNEMIFIDKLNGLMPYACNLNNKIEIVMPVGNLMKHEIVKLGLDIDAPLDLCWSCYNSGEKHCGDCGPCYMRKTAFDINGTKEVVEYETQ